MIEQSPILGPVVLLVAWTLVMWVWMYATRIPAIRRLRIRMDPTVPGTEMLAPLPPAVRWKADNYNHLMEQPTIFYAVALVLALTEAGSGINVILAWFYVLLRIIHSLVQVTTNRIMLRFGIFNLSTLCLIGMTWSALRVVFSF
jgi:hypothetical protein